MVTQSRPMYSCAVHMLYYIILYYIIHIYHCLGVDVRLHTYYFIVFVCFCLSNIWGLILYVFPFSTVFIKRLKCFNCSLLEVLFLPRPNEGSRASCCVAVGPQLWPLHVILFSSCCIIGTNYSVLHQQENGQAVTNWSKWTHTHT